MYSYIWTYIYIFIFIYMWISKSSCWLQVRKIYDSFSCYTIGFWNPFHSALPAYVQLRIMMKWIEVTWEVIASTPNVSKEKFWEKKRSACSHIVWQKKILEWSLFDVSDFCYSYTLI